MNQRTEQPQPEPDETLPPKLAADLAGLYSVTPPIARPTDGAIRFAIRGHFESQFARRHALRRVLRWTSAAAAIAAIVLISIALLPSKHRGNSPANVAIQSFAKEDLNADGRVDVLDAFFLARQIKAGGSLDAKWDVNSDGVVDDRDVAALAAVAVSLQRRAVQ